MNKYEIVQRIEKFAPLETQEKWDSSGWGVDVELTNPSPLTPLPQGARGNKNVNKILFALTVTDDVVEQARKNCCDMIISHHPLFFVPFEYKDINIYSAHTNLDLAQGGTTDTLIKKLGFNKTRDEGFVRIVELEKEITVGELREKLLKISPKLRYVNNKNTQKIKTIAFCAGSGSEFINETACDAFVTGDLKFHTALDSQKVLFDIGHFESEIFAPEILKEITKVGEEGIIADEKSPFI